MDSEDDSRVSTSIHRRRRRFLQVLGATSIAGVAGCLGGGDDDSEGDDPTDDSENGGPTDDSENGGPTDDSENGGPTDDNGTDPWDDSAGPVDLRVEYDRDPINLTPDATPRFSWEVTATSRGAEQTGYRIRVASDPDSLEEPDVWDSGWVDSSASIQVPYDGPTLDPDATYYWAVDVRKADQERGRSDPAQFATAIPEGGWQGEWIGPEYEGEERPAPLLRREFDIDGEVERARAHVSGLGFYELHLNGERVGDRVLDPGRTNPQETVLYSTYDVTGSLQAGTNAIGAALGRGRFGEPVENVWFWDEAPWWSDPQLLLQLNVEFVDGTSTSIVTDGEWTMTDGPTRFDSLFAGEVYDARAEKSGWTEPGYDDSGWETPPIVDPPGGEYVPQRVQPITVADTLEPVDVTEPEDGVYVFDLGQIIAGWTELTVDGPEGTEVTLVQGEKLHDDGTVNVDQNHVEQQIQTDTYILSGEGTETWESSFTYKGLRYVQVEGYPGEPGLDAIRGKFLHTRFDEESDSAFTCSNDLLNQIHENTLWAYRNNHHSLPQDTPKYEKNGWTGDAQLTTEVGIYNYDTARLHTKWLRDFADAQLEDGEVPTIVPTSGWSYEGAEGWGGVQGPTPGWDVAYFLIPWWLYQYYGDERILETHYEGMKLYLDWLEGHADGYIVRVGLGDWSNPPEGPAITSTAYYYRMAQITAEAARRVDAYDDAAEYMELATNIYAAFNNEFLDAGDGVYRTGQADEYRQTSNVFPLAFDMVPEEYEEAVVANVVEDVVETNDGHLDTRTLGTKYLLPVLSEHGHHDVAYTVATQTDPPSWGHWIENGRTSLLEFWSLGSRSWNHHFLGTIDEWFYKHLAGIQVAEPGFAHVRIAPKPVGDLDSVSSRVDTIRGLVVSEWERTGDDLEFAVSIPGNATATVEIPTLGGDAVDVHEGGEPIWESGAGSDATVAGIESVLREGDRIVVEVGAGEYEFELQQAG